MSSRVRSVIAHPIGKLLVGFSLACALAGVFLAGIVTYDLDYELLAEPHGSSASGTNSVCLPYDLAVGDKASDLFASISPTPTCVLKLDRATDGHVRYPVTITNEPSPGHPCALPTGSPPTGGIITSTADFDLVPGEGYRVVLDSGTSATYTVAGQAIPDVTVALYKVGETTPEGSSNSGMNDYCPPYNRVVDKASTLWDEFQCPLGSCSTRLCTEDGGQPCPSECTPCDLDSDCPGEACHESGFCTEGSEVCPVSCFACVDDGDCGETCEDNVCTIDGEVCTENCTSCSENSDCGEVLPGAPPGLRRGRQRGRPMQRRH